MGEKDSTGRGGPERHGTPLATEASFAGVFRVHPFGDSLLQRAKFSTLVDRRRHRLLRPDREALSRKHCGPAALSHRGPARVVRRPLVGPSRSGSRRPTWWHGRGRSSGVAFVPWTAAGDGLVPVKVQRTASCSIFALGIECRDTVPPSRVSMIVATGPTSRTVPSKPATLTVSPA